jgi:hypothetical protein
VGAVAEAVAGTGPHDGEPGSVTQVAHTGLDELFRAVKNPHFDRSRLTE